MELIDHVALVATVGLPASETPATRPRVPGEAASSGGSYAGGISVDV